MVGKPDYMKYDGRNEEPPYDTEAAPSSCAVESIVGIQVGDRVQCYVYVCGEAVPMHQGIVTELRDGYYMVDRMSLHGGRPWIVAERHATKVDANSTLCVQNQRKG